MSPVFLQVQNEGKEAQQPESYGLHTWSSQGQLYFLTNWHGCRRLQLERLVQARLRTRRPINLDAWCLHVVTEIEHFQLNVNLYVSRLDSNYVLTVT